MKERKKCPICGHYPDENIYCTCKCHDRFRVKNIK